MTILIILFLSFISFLAPWSWFCSLFEHLRHIYFILSLGLFIFYSFKKKYSYIFICVLGIIINGAILYTAIFPDHYSFTIKRPGDSVFFHNVHNGNDPQTYVAHLKDAASLNIFFEVNDEMNSILQEKFKKLKKIVNMPEENNYGWGIWGKEDFKIKNKFAKEETTFVYKIQSKQDSLVLFFVHLPPPVFNDLWAYQNEAIEWLLSEIKNEKGRIIIAGDFNLTPWSYSFRKLVIGLSKYKIVPKSNMTEPTWPSFLPLIALDHVFSNFNILVERQDARGSDHSGFRIEF